MLWRWVLRLVNNLDWLIAIILAVVLSVLGIIGSVSSAIISSATLLVLGLLCFSALRDRDASSQLKKTVAALELRSSLIFESDELLSDRARTGISRVLPQTVNFDWLPSIRSASHVTIVKVRLSSEDPLYYDAFESVLAKGGSVTLVIEDPRSPSMWLRYMDEPNPSRLGSHPSDSISAHALEDLAVVLYRFHTWKRRLIETGTDVSKLTIRVSPHYPTHAFLKFDDALYVHHYPYMERGFHSPAFLFGDPSASVHRFLTRCIESIVDASVALDVVFDEIWQDYQAGSLSDTRVFSSRIGILPRTE